LQPCREARTYGQAYKHEKLYGGNAYFQDVYHSAWENNWGFVPMTDEELEYAGKRLKQVIIPEMT
jgi:hypothetical protein